MGFIGRIGTDAPRTREMGAGDFIWLAALGTAARGPARLEDICRAFDVITLGQWLPVGELVTASVAEMIRGGHLQAAPGPGQRLRLTARGRETLALLLAQPVGRPASVFGQVGLRLKLAFLDLAAPMERRRHLDALIALHEDELARALADDEPSAAPGPLAAHWRRHETARLHADIAALQRLNATSATP